MMQDVFDKKKEENAKRSYSKTLQNRLDGQGFG